MGKIIFKLKNKLFFLFLIFIFIKCDNKTIVIPVDFTESIQPKPESKEWRFLNYSRNEFSVKNINGQLVIDKLKDKLDKINKCELKISKGRLIGIDMGEWGGQLTFNPTDTSKKKIDIKSGNIKFIFYYKNQIYFIEGLAHKYFSNGALYRLDLDDSNFKYKKLLDFEDAPEAFTIYNDKFLIATHENFYVVKDLKKEILFKETFWSSLYPNSIAVFDEKNVFLGIRSGIVKLDLKTKEIKFYKYN